MQRREDLVGHYPLLRQLLVLDTWFYEHPYRTDSHILLLFLLTNVLIVSRFGYKRLLMLLM